MCRRRDRTWPAYSGTSAGSAPSAATTTCLARAGCTDAPPAAAWLHRALAGRGHRRAHARVLEDPRTRPLRRGRQQAVPASRVERAVVRCQAAHQPDALQRGREVSRSMVSPGKPSSRSAAAWSRTCSASSSDTASRISPIWRSASPAPELLRPARSRPAAPRAWPRTSPAPAPPRTARGRRCGTPPCR